MDTTVAEQVGTSATGAVVGTGATGTVAPGNTTARMITTALYNSTVGQNTTTAIAPVNNTSATNGTTTTATTTVTLKPANATTFAIGGLGSTTGEVVNVTTTTTATTQSQTNATTPKNSDASDEQDNDVFGNSTTTKTSTTTSSTSTTTIPVYEVPVDEYSCSVINDTYAVVNSTDHSQGTVVSVTCRPPAKLVSLGLKTQDVYTCDATYWRPVTPTCKIPDGGVSSPVGIIIGCTIGGFVCLVLVIIGLVMLCKTIQESKQQRIRDQEFTEKMDQIGLFVNTSFQDSVGMPVLTMDTRDSGLRGRVTDTTTDPGSQTNQESCPDIVKLGADLF